jgi:ribonuclease D
MTSWSPQSSRRVRPSTSGSVPAVVVTIVEGDLPSGLAQTLRASGQVAVDTETSGLEWATDRLELCQLFSPATGAVLLRRVDQRPPAELHSLLRDESTLKVFHHAPFDLKFLESRWGVRTANIACTKAASKILAPDADPAEHSLQPLLMEVLGVEITKGRARTSDWGSDHLTDEQIAYAAGDVEHLLDLYAVLRRRLDNAGLSDLFTQVCAYLPIDAHLAVSGFPNPLTY